MSSYQLGPVAGRISDQRQENLHVSQHNVLQIITADELISAVLSCPVLSCPETRKSTEISSRFTARQMSSYQLLCRWAEGSTADQRQAALLQITWRPLKASHAERTMHTLGRLIATRKGNFFPSLPIAAGKACLGASLMQSLLLTGRTVLPRPSYLATQRRKCIECWLKLQEMWKWNVLCFTILGYNCHFCDIQSENSDFPESGLRGDTTRSFCECRWDEWVGMAV